MNNVISLFYVNNLAAASNLYIVTLMLRHAIESEASDSLRVTSVGYHLEAI